MQIESVGAAATDFAQGCDAIVVTGADSGYFPLAMDMVTSLLALTVAELPLAFLDLGLEPWQVDWLRARGVTVEAPKTLLAAPPGVAFTLRQMGVLARPFLREIFPGHAIYVWIDADVWLQTADGLKALVTGAAERGAAMARQNERAYRFSPWLFGWMHKHYVLGFGALRGVPLAWRPMINAGVFAMRADAGHWTAWRDRYQHALDRTGLPGPHDQLALNAAVYLDRLDTAFIPATANWICDLATPMWDEGRRRFCAPYPPYPPISILHLAGPAKTGAFDIRTTAGGHLRRGLRYAEEAACDGGDGQAMAKALT